MRPHTFLSALTLLLTARRGRQAACATMLAALLPITAQASDIELPPAVADRLAVEEQQFEQHGKNQAPFFRLVKTLEDFGPRKDGGRPVRVSVPDELQAELDRPGSPPLVATLHDIRSGLPVDSCHAPCTLDGSKRFPDMAVFYRAGSLPTGRAVLPGQELPPLYMPFNEYDALPRREACREEAQKRLETERRADAVECFRVPPMMPPMAEHSGHCDMEFTVLTDGSVRDVVATACTEQVFCNESALAVSRWHYLPKIAYGEPVEAKKQTSLITYKLAEENGDLIPEPDSPMVPCIGMS